MLMARAFLYLTRAIFFVLLSGCVDDPNHGEELGAVTPPGKLSVEVRPLPHGLDRDRFYVQISFHNDTPKPVYILKPVDGSFPCWHMPYYRFTVRHPDGRILRFGNGCGRWCSGLWADTKWPQDYLVEIPPGESYERQRTVYYLNLERSGAYTVSFEYVYEPTEELFTPPPQAWRGSVKAPDFVLIVPKR